MTSTQLAASRINYLHKSLQSLLIEVEKAILLERIPMLEQMKQQRQRVLKADKSNSSIENRDVMDIDSDNNISGVIVGIDRDDPMLAWSNLHKPAHLPPMTE